MKNLLLLSALFVCSFAGLITSQNDPLPPGRPVDGDQWIRSTDGQMFTYNSTYGEWLGQDDIVEFGKATNGVTGNIDFTSRSTCDTTSTIVHGAFYGKRMRIMSVYASQSAGVTATDIDFYAVVDATPGLDNTLGSIAWTTKTLNASAGAGDTLEADQALAVYLDSSGHIPSNNPNDPSIVITLKERVIAPAWSTTQTPISDLGTTSYYKGYVGGIYGQGSNTIPAAHAARQPSIGASETILAIGMSSAAQIFNKVISNGTGPAGWTYINASLAQRTVEEWADTTNNAFDLADAEIADSSKTPADITVLWACMASDLRDSLPVELPFKSGQAYVFANHFARVLRIAHQRYPNLKVVLITAHPRVKVPAEDAFADIISEPYAYEDNFAVMWLIEEAIWQQDGNAARRFGDLSASAIGWVDWGFYGWATGTARSWDGYSYPDSYIQVDNIHPAVNGENVFANGIIAILNAL